MDDANDPFHFPRPIAFSNRATTSACDSGADASDPHVRITRLSPARSRHCFSLKELMLAL